MDVVMNTFELEFQAMDAWNKKLSTKVEEFNHETNNAKKSALADELTNMLEKHIKVIRESKIVQSFSASDRADVEKELSHMEDMIMLLKFEKASIDLLDHILGDFDELS